VVFGDNIAQLIAQIILDNCNNHNVEEKVH